MTEVNADEYALPMAITRHFDLSSLPYDNTPIQIQRRTTYPDQSLFIDRLLSLAEIDGPTHYPPTSPAGYRRLLGAIHTSPLDRLKKDCFYYYLLRDYGGEDGHDRAGAFGKVRCLSKTWRVFMDGYWALDNGLWDEAITHLTNPAITAINFPSEIIKTLHTLAPSPLSLSLIHTFLLTRPPTSETPQEDIDLYTISLASASSVPNAFSFIRSLPLEKQGHLRRKVWEWAFGASTIDGSTISQTAIKEILHLPLLPEEDDQLLQFLLTPPRTISPNALSLLHDLVTLRLIHQGKYAESLQLDKELAGSGGREEDRQRRREMVREFIAILPEAQRRALAVDGEMIAGRREKERVNGEGYMDIEMIKKADASTKTATNTNTNKRNKTIEVIDIDSDSPSRQIAPSFPLDLNPEPSATSTSTPNKPANSRVVSISANSPFSGPPRFAPSSNAVAQSPVQRVLSGSPFTLPMSRGANAVRSASISRTPTQQGNIKELPIPRPKSRPVMEDEVVQVEKKGKGRKRARPSDHDHDHDMDMDDEDEEQEQGQDGNDKNEEAVEEGQEMDISPEKPKQSHSSPQLQPQIQIETSEQGEQQDEQEQHPEPAQPEPEPTPRKSRTTRSKPSPSPAARRSTRQSTLPPPPSPREKIPGSFDLSSVPEDQSAVIKPKPARRSRTVRNLSMVSTQTQDEGKVGGRSRMTRSVSRALSLDPDGIEESHVGSGPAAKRARSRRLSVASEVSEVPSVPASERKTRTRRGEASERGSPTPSVAGRTPRKSTRTSTRK